MAADELCVYISGILTRLTPILNENGSRVQQENGYAYRTADGAVMTVLFENEQRQTGTSSPAAGCSVAQQAASDTPQDVQDVAAEDSCQLWSERRTSFLISAYKEKKALLGKKSGFRKEKALWQALAEAINKEFGCSLSAVQAENKWKSMERAYKKTKAKNNSSGHSRVSCSHEEELSDVLEHEHNISPAFLLAPGRVIQNESSSKPLDTELALNYEAEPSQELQEANHNKRDLSQEPQETTSHKRRRRDTSIENLLKVLQDPKNESAERFEGKMSLLERLVVAIEEKPKQAE